jgi:hypothetical protein
MALRPNGQLAGPALSAFGNYEGYVVGLLVGAELPNVIHNRGDQAW